MRIRQVRPEFFSDPMVAKLSPDVRLTYIGLWCVADDAGYLVWDEPHIAAMLYPYESVRVRTARVQKAGAQLLDTGRVVFYPCGCVLIPKLEEHQRIGGNKSFTVRDKHRVHTRTDKSAVTLGNGRVGNGTLDAPAGASADAPDEEERLRAAFRRQGLPA